MSKEDHDSESLGENDSSGFSDGESSDFDNNSDEECVDISFTLEEIQECTIFEAKFNAEKQKYIKTENEIVFSKKMMAVKEHMPLEFLEKETNKLQPPAGFPNALASFKGRPQSGEKNGWLHVLNPSEIDSPLLQSDPVFTAMTTKEQKDISLVVGVSVLGTAAESEAALLRVCQGEDPAAISEEYAKELANVFPFLKKPDRAATVSMKRGLLKHGASKGGDFDLGEKGATPQKRTNEKMDGGVSVPAKRAKPSNKKTQGQAAEKVTQPKTSTIDVAVPAEKKVPVVVQSQPAEKKLSADAQTRPALSSPKKPSVSTGEMVTLSVTLPLEKTQRLVQFIASLETPSE